ncbi:MAG: ribonuclease E/G, partial [Nitrospirae bacterium]|nr:ribonuclease E/G [Nitrospirota bacterium]
MSIEIIINATKEETRVALFENKVVTEFHIDRKRDREIVGNIYKGRVVKVLPGMHASFVDIGLQKGAFLYVDDVASHVDDYAKLMEYEVDEKIGHEKESHRSKRSGAVSIEDLLQEGQEIMVQVSKEPMGTKGPRVTTYISLPGRYLVYMPTIDHIGISRRITQEEERARLKEIIARMRRPGTGYIVRTVSGGKSEGDLMPDMEFLQIL